MKTKSHYDSPLGGITLIADETALLGLWFDWQPGYADDDSAVLGDSPTIGAAKRWLDEYFAGCILGPKCRCGWKARRFARKHGHCCGQCHTAKRFHTADSHVDWS